MKKLFPFPGFRRWGAWSVSLLSATSLVPLLLVNWLPTAAPPAKEDKQPSLPPPSQLPSPPTGQGQPLVSAAASSLEPPRPKLAKPSPPPVTQEKPTAPAPVKKEPARKAEPPASTSRQPEHLSLPAAPPSYAPPPIEIKVAVLRDAPGTTLGVSQQAAILDQNGRVLQSLKANNGVWVQPNGGSLTVGDWQLPGAVWVQPSAGGFVYVGDRWYRGKMLLVSQGSNLLAVNAVDLEHYLYSVVGSEMHANAPIAALKAQAIAARSYALVHIIRPASAWYNLGNSQRWQVYKGLASEYNTSQQAVDGTAGQILSHRGGVVESLYAATDEIVSRAHGGRGMSQTGAYDLAAQGYDYQQILNRYYPGVSLARLVLQ